MYLYLCYGNAFYVDCFHLILAQLSHCESFINVQKSIPQINNNQRNRAMSNQANMITVQDTDSVQASFNIMKGKQISEKISFDQFNIGDDFVEATFDREYMSEMDHSPSHVTMTVIPLLTQRLCYVWACQKFGIKYSPEGEEKIKLWPTWLEFKYPKLIESEKALNYRVDITSLKKVDDNKYYSQLTSTVNNELEINVKGLIILV
jgi:hypothetical protein